MAPVANLYRLVWGGRLFTAESWSCSVHVNATAGLNLAASNFTAALVAWMGRSDSNISVAAKLDFVKFNQINPATGRYTLPTSNNDEQLGLAAGVRPAAPGQDSVAVSLRTALPRGRGHVGRFYPPTGVPAPSDVDGLISAAIATLMATSAASLISSVNTTVGAGAQVVVFSKIGQSVQPVLNVRVGRVVDTMRSRRAQLSENYIQAGIA